MKRIIFTVTNDLIFDQRMDRICGTLADNGYHCVLIGRKLRKSLDLTQKSYEQIRIPCLFSKGKAFYLEYNLRLFIYLLFRRTDIYCCIDLDTALPVWLISVIKQKKLVYDAHEFFSEMEEIISRPLIHKAWLMLERFIMKRVKYGYTISEGFAKLYADRYGKDFKVIRNVPRLGNYKIVQSAERMIIYQGALNEGRGLEASIKAMKFVEDGKLQIFGNGPKADELKKLARTEGVEDRVIFRGAVKPEQLRNETMRSWVGLTLFSEKGMHHQYSLANRFFDYIHAGVPQIAMNYPEYRAFNDYWGIAILLNDLSPKAIADAINYLLVSPSGYNRMKENCLSAREIHNWEQESIKLIEFYKSL